MPETILIVDHDPAQRRLLAAMVARFGYRPLTADGGDAALKLIAGEARIDGVVLDLVMPDRDGLGVLAKMRARASDVPVIVQTALGGLDTVIAAMRAGAADFVVKPANPERLQVSLRNALELQRLKRARADASAAPLIEPSPAMAASWPEPTEATATASSALALTNGRGDIRPLEEIEGEVIRFAIAHYRGQMSEVARRLKIGRSTLYRKLEGLGLDGANEKAPENSAAD